MFGEEGLLCKEEWYHSGQVGGGGGLRGEREHVVSVYSVPPFLSCPRGRVLPLSSPLPVPLVACYYVAVPREAWCGKEGGRH